MPTYSSELHNHTNPIPHSTPCNVAEKWRGQSSSMKTFELLELQVFPTQSQNFFLKINFFMETKWLQSLRNGSSVHCTEHKSQVSLLTIATSRRAPKPTHSRTCQEITQVWLFTGSLDLSASRSAYRAIMVKEHNTTERNTNFAQKINK